MKRISPAAFVALKEALTHIYWRKQDLRGFLEVCLGGPELVSRLDWSATKREAVGALVTYLQRNESQYQEMLLTLMVEAAAIEDFAHLQREDDGAAKVAAARRAVAALRKHVAGFSHLRVEQDRAEERKRVARELAQQRQETAAALEALRTRFAELIGQGHQERGYALEALLRDLFDVFDMDPRASFRITGEQVDGYFTFESTEYLLEAKWQTQWVGIQELDAFKAKIDRKLDNTLGLFWAINGFSPDAVARHSTNRPAIILADGSDLMAVLEGRIGLDELLRRKRRHAAQTGNILLTAFTILGT